MAKKKISELDLTDDDELTAFDPTIAATKLPANITAGKTALLDFMAIPCDSIIPFQSKDDADFSRFSGEKWERYVDTIREYGVIEVITVRALPDGRFELLAGETRWRGSVEAGLSTIPAHIYRDLSDVRARGMFAITNLMRRDLSTQDKINGWWHYLQSTKGADVQDDLELAAAIDSQAADISLRQIQRYAKMKSLIPEIVAAVDGKLPQVAAYQLAFLPEDKQRDVIPYLNSITEPQAKALRALAEQKTDALSKYITLLPGESIAEFEWDAKTIKRILFPVKKASYNTTFSAASKAITKTVKKRLSPAYYDRAEEIIDKALTMYFETDPEAELNKTT